MNPLLRYRDFGDFQDVGRRQVGSAKIRNYNRQSAKRARCASACQISSKSVERLRRYGNLTVFQNGGRPPSWICWERVWTTHDEH